MTKHLLSLAFVCLVTTAFAAEPDPGKLYAWYRSDGIKASGARVTAWESASRSAGNRSLSRVFGKPQPFRVKAPGGDQTVLRLDGKSALWQTVGDWGKIDGGRTVIAFVRLAAGAEGYLFDGSAKSGQSHAYVQGGEWHAGGTSEDPATQKANPGEWQAHAFVFNKTAGGTSVTHSMTGAGAKPGGANSTQPLAGFILGENAEGKLGLKCDVAEVQVYDRALPGAELEAAMTDLQTRWGQPTDLPADQQASAAATPSDPRVFRKVLRAAGDDGVKSFRIPGLTTSKKGTIIAVFDIRHNGSGDLPANIDVGVMRSMDNGETWTPMQAALDYDAAEPGSNGNGVGDPAVLADMKTGAIFIAALWSKGNHGWGGSGPGMTPEETGQFVIAKSTDDGATWSKPVSITPEVKDPAWKLCFQGPGNGIQLRDGTLVFPAQYKGADNVPHSCFVASSDGGKTWKISPPAIPDKPPTSEAQIAELKDGSMLLTMRNESRSGKRAWARWQWSGNVLKGKWEKWWLEVPDPTCQASLVRHPNGMLLFSNPNSSNQRVDMTIRASKDDGKTWTDGKLLDPRPSGYSCMTVLKDGRIGILYETGESNYAETLTFARFPLEWVLEK